MLGRRRTQVRLPGKRCGRRRCHGLADPDWCTTAPIAFLSGIPLGAAYVGPAGFGAGLTGSVVRRGRIQGRARWPRLLIEQGVHQAALHRVGLPGI